MEGGSECDRLQARKAALYFTLGQYCKNYESEKGLKLHPNLAAALTEVTHSYLQDLSRDLESFAKHGKRSQVNADDVLLVCRKTREMHKFITNKADQLVASKAKDVTKKKDSSSRPKQKTETPLAKENSKSQLSYS